jgi:hypothetical protein
MRTFQIESELPSRLGFADAEAVHKPAGPCVHFSRIFSSVNHFDVDFTDVVLGDDAVADFLDGSYVGALVIVSLFITSLTRTPRRSQNPTVATRKIPDHAGKPLVCRFFSQD